MNRSLHFMPSVDVPPMPAVIMPFKPDQSGDVSSGFDLENHGPNHGRGSFSVIRPRCPQGNPGEIVVCAPNAEKERLRPQTDQYIVTEGLPRAAMRVRQGMELDVYVDQSVMPGVVSNRVMIGGKVKF